MNSGDAGNRSGSRGRNGINGAGERLVATRRRWTGRRLLAALAGGWLAIAVLDGMLHGLLGGMAMIDLAALLLAGAWSMVVGFVGLSDRCARP